VVEARTGGSGAEHLPPAATAALAEGEAGEASHAAVLAAGIGSGLAAGAAMAATAMVIGEIAAEPTAVAGIDSSTWTPITSITSFLFGVDAFHGSFAVLSILFGLGSHLVLSVAFGIVGVAFIAVTQGARPGALGASIQGLAFGLSLQIVVLNLGVNAIQEVHTVYESIPQWGWWVAHAAYGAVLGMAASRALPARV